MLNDKFEVESFVTKKFGILHVLEKPFCEKNRTPNLIDESQESDLINIGSA